MRHKPAIYILAGIILMFLAIFSFFYLLKEPTVTGNVISDATGFSFHESSESHDERVNLVVNESGTYTFSPNGEGKLTSLKASGSMTTNGSAKVYIEKDGVKYVLFDSTRHLFDIDIHVLPEYKKIYSGDEVLIQIVLFNLRGFGSGNVTVTYSIRDQDGNLLAVEEEQVFVETQAKFVRKLLMPSDIKPGTYFAFVEVKSNVPLGSGSDTFEVRSKLSINYGAGAKSYVVGISAIAAVALVFMLIMSAYREHEKKKMLVHMKENEGIVKDEKLNLQLRALEGAYKAKFISEESYLKQKERVEKKIKEGNN